MAGFADGITQACVLQIPIHSVFPLLILSFLQYLFYLKGRVTKKQRTHTHTQVQSFRKHILKHSGWGQMGAGLCLRSPVSSPASFWGSWGKYQKMSQGFMQLLWETEMRLLTPGFGLVQSSPLWSPGERTSRRKNFLSACNDDFQISMC